MDHLVDLDLEWSEAITDDALAHLASAPRLRWVDLCGCTGITAAGVEALPQARPGIDLDLFSE